MKEPCYRFSTHRLGALCKKEALQWLRSPLLLIIFLSAVTLQLVLFGHSVRSRVTHIPLAVVDEDRSFLSRRLISILMEGGDFELDPSPLAKADLPSGFQKGSFQAALVIPSDFSLKLQKNEKPRLSASLDGSEASTALLAKSRLLEGIAHFYESLRDSASAANSRRFEITAHYEILHNPRLSDAFFMVPGIIGAVLFLLVTAIAAASFAREKETGTLSSVQMSPVHPVEIFLGKTIPLFLISLFFSVLGFLVGHLWFQIPLSGSLSLLAMSTVCFILFCVGLGFVTSSYSRTQFQAVFTSLFITIPGIFLSGAMGQTDVWWPAFLRVLSAFNPLFYYVKLSRGTLIAQTGWKTGWPWFLPLLLAAAVFFALSLLVARRFFLESPPRR